MGIYLIQVHNKLYSYRYCSLLLVKRNSHADTHLYMCLVRIHDDSAGAFNYVRTYMYVHVRTIASYCSYVANLAMAYENMPTGSSVFVAIAFSGISMRMTNVQHNYTVAIRI